MITLAQIYNETNSQVFNHVRRVVKHLHDSEDVTSDVYVKIEKLMRKESTRFDEDKASLSTWVHTVTNSVILDFFRTNHQEYYKAVSDFKKNGDDTGLDSPFQFVAPTRHNADAKILRTETRNRIAKALRSLKPNYRKIAYYYFLKDLPYIEVADLLDIPMGSVKGMLNRCRTKLKEELKGVYTLKTVKTEMSEA